MGAPNNEKQFVTHRDPLPEIGCYEMKLHLVTLSMPVRLPGTLPNHASPLTHSYDRGSVLTAWLHVCARRLRHMNTNLHTLEDDAQIKPVGNFGWPAGILRRPARKFGWRVGNFGRPARNFGQQEISAGRPEISAGRPEISAGTF